MKQTTPWQRLIKLLRHDRKMITQLCLYAVFSGLVGLSLPLGIQTVIHYIQVGQITTSWIVLIFLVIGGVVLTGTLQIMQLRISEILQQRIYVRYSFDFAYRLPRIDRHYVEGKNISEYANRFFDVISLQKGLSKLLLELFPAMLLIIFSLAVLSFYHPFFIFFSLAIVALVILVFRPIVRRGLTTSLAESKHKYRTAHWLQEIARADWSFRLTPKSSHSLGRLDGHATDYLHSREAHFKVLWTHYVWMIALKSISVAALLGLGGYLVINQKMNLGQFVAAEILILLILGAVEKIIQLLETVYDVFTSLEKLGQVEDMPMAFEEPAEDFNRELFPVQLTSVEGGVATILLEVQRGENQLVIGADMRMSHILLRSLIETSVSRKFQPRWNHEVPDPPTMAAGLQNVGWYSSHQYAFDGTISENILQGRSGIGSDQLMRAMRTVEIHQYVERLAEGAATTVNTHTLDACILQRMLLARAIVHSPQLLIISFYGSPWSSSEQSQILADITRNYPETTVVCTSAERLDDVAWRRSNLSNITE